MTARASSQPLDAANPCTKRKTDSVSIDVDSAHPAVATDVTNRPLMIAGLRPNLSEIGPCTSCPTAMPSMNMVSVN